MKWNKGDGLFIHSGDYKISFAEVDGQGRFEVWHRFELLGCTVSLGEAKDIAHHHAHGELNLSGLDNRPRYACANAGGYQ